MGRRHVAAGLGLRRAVASMPPPRTVYLLQRKATPLGAGLGKTTGWIHRKAPRQRGVEFLRGVTYKSVEDDGFHVEVAGEERVLDVTDVVLCAGQTSVDDLFHELRNDPTRPFPCLPSAGAEHAGELTPSAPSTRACAWRRACVGNRAPGAPDPVFGHFWRWRGPGSAVEWRGTDIATPSSRRRVENMAWRTTR